MPTRIDPRGPRFAAALTTVVLALVLVTGSAWLLAVQGVVFAAGALLGLPRAPYGVLYARLVRPRLGPPGELEDAAPPRFAQTVGLVFAVAGVIAFAAGLTAVAYVAVAAALAAAFLNAAFGFCLGCEIYLAYRRLFPSQPNTTEVAS
ncbi:DUF4395 domain-containing protein [Jiangella rhizosphaerae]|uniref:DUF4395 domain-containing protein n=1 Tax=Jiangella rhizosphaerae TaxID=2293569 RepID=A0A418KWF3_9ACTN|nr:DUF4395 domain-containing protein [Jiangella rhizosphaerae]RIQ34109.1 DUF4395 domain-containing protein [Jiangella rhizosphaerae]